MNKEKLKKIWEVFTYFFRISWFTFGGGWSIVAQMQKDYVEKKRATWHISLATGRQAYWEACSPWWAWSCRL